MRKNIINSISISNNQLFHILLDKKKREPAVIGVSYFDIDEDITSVDSAIKEISDYVKKDKIANVVLIREDIIKHLFIFDKVEDVNMRAQILNEFKTTYDIQLAEYWVDYETYAFGDKIIVLLAAMPKETGIMYLNIFKKYNFYLQCFETDINSLKRIVEYNKFNEVTLFIHMREDSTLFLVNSKDILFSFRELKFGFKDILAAVSDKINKDNEFVEKLLLNQGLLNEEFDIADSTDKLTIEIQRTIDYYTNQYKSTAIGKIIISGKLVNIKQIDKFLRNIFLIDCTLIDTLKLVYVNTEIPDIDNIFYFAETLGCALRVE